MFGLRRAAVRSIQGVRRMSELPSAPQGHYRPPAGKEWRPRNPDHEHLLFEGEFNNRVSTGIFLGMLFGGTGLIVTSVKLSYP